MGIFEVSELKITIPEGGRKSQTIEELSSYEQHPEAATIARLCKVAKKRHNGAKVRGKRGVPSSSGLDDPQG